VFDIVSLLIVAFVVFMLIGMMVFGRSREVHVGRYRAGRDRHDRAMPPADDAGHQGSFTRPPDLRPGPGETREP
jgi:hypothetical protein